MAGLEPGQTRQRRRGWWRGATAFLAAVALGGCASSGAGADGSGDGALLGNSTSASGSYLAARHAERVRDIPAAARFMDRLLEEDFANLELLNRGHYLLVADGRVAEAAKVARRIVELQSAATLPSLTLVAEDAKAGRFAAAEQRMQALPTTGANRVLTPLLSAWLAAAQGEAERALTLLRPLAEITGMRAFQDLHAGLIAELGGRSAEAEQSYRAVLEAQENLSLRVVEIAGRYFERTGRPEEAKTIYRRYLDQNPDSAMMGQALKRIGAGRTPEALVPSGSDGLAEAFYNLALVLRQDTDGQGALFYARLALHLRPALSAALVLLGESLETQSRREDANAAYEKVPAGEALSYVARLRIASNLNAMDRPDEAIERLDALASEYPEQIEPLVTLGNLLRVRERFAAAAAAYDRAVARLRQPDKRHWSLFYARGIALERSKQWPRAEADFIKALDLQPEQPDVLNYLAYSWVEQGVNFERARAMLERAVALRPNNGYIVDSLGWVLYRKGLYDEATPLLERAVELQPEDPVILDHLGDAYWRVGRQSEARFQWQRSLANKPEAELKRSLEEKLVRGIETPAANRQTTP